MRRSNEPDLRILSQLQTLERVALAFASLLGVAVVALWLIPSLRVLAPPGWALMKFNTAACLVLSVWSAYLQAPGSPNPRVRLGRGLALIVLAVASLSLLEWSGHAAFEIDEWLVEDPSAALYPGRMSVQTSVGYVFVGGALLCLRAERGLGGGVADLASVLTLGLTIIVAAGYLFDATHLFGTDALTRLSPQTLAGFLCLSLVLGIRRSRQGYSDVLVGAGIGSRIARRVLPIGILIPFALALAHRYVVDVGMMDVAYAAALRAALLSLLILLVVIWMADRINGLEAELRQASLTDALTGINNRRGFMLLAEQELRGLRRSGQGATLYFIDVDGLKVVNDRLGHEAGSTLIRTVAEALTAEFREGDVVGRMGGDEFCALVAGDQPPPEAAIARLQARARTLQAARSLPFDVQFSSGFAAVDSEAHGALEAAIRLADQRMYAAKQSRGRLRPVGGGRAAA